MNNNEELFDDLFAYRIYLTDIYDDESDIIKKLKIKLYELGYEIRNINRLIYNFYEYFGIPDITMEMIQNAYVHIYMTPDNSNDLFIRLMSRMTMRNEIVDTLSNLVYNSSVVLDVGNMNMNMNDEENERIILSEDNFNKLEVITLDDDIDNDCSICIDSFKKGDEVIKLRCNHMFHMKCIKSYLLKYDNKCPLCRTNVLSDEPNELNQPNDIVELIESIEIPESNDL